jgi:hypothetical protein
MAEQLAGDKSASARALSASLLASITAPFRARTTRRFTGQEPGSTGSRREGSGQHPCRSVVEDLHSLLDEKKDEVKYMAAASLLRISTNAGRRHIECEVPAASPASAVAQSLPESAGAPK